MVQKNSLSTPSVTFLSIVLAVAALLFVWSFDIAYAIRSTNCHTLTGYENAYTQSGYGSVRNFFSASGIPLITGVCTSQRDWVHTVVGDGLSTTYVWKDSYYWNGSSWVNVPLRDYFRNHNANGWVQGKAYGRVDTVTAPVWYVAYVCQDIGGSWKCGCATQSCVGGNWQLQQLYGVKESLAGLDMSLFNQKWEFYSDMFKFGKVAIPLTAYLDEFNVTPADVPGAPYAAVCGVSWCPWATFITLGMSPSVFGNHFYIEGPSSLYTPPNPVSNGIAMYYLSPSTGLRQDAILYPYKDFTSTTYQVCDPQTGCVYTNSCPSGNCTAVTTGYIEAFWPPRFGVGLNGLALSYVFDGIDTYYPEEPTAAHRFINVLIDRHFDTAGYLGPRTDLHNFGYFEQ